MKKISVVIYCYNEHDTLPHFYTLINKVKDKLKKEAILELIFVDDGSTDTTLRQLRILSKKDENIKYAALSRHFGKEASIYAGLKRASGDYITVVSVSSDDPIELLIKMFEMIESEKYDCIATRISYDNCSFFKRVFIKLFYKIVNKLTNLNLVMGERDFRLFTKQVLEAILELEEYNRYTKGIFNYVGFDTKWISYKPHKRKKSKDKDSFVKLCSYALETIISFSFKPLVFSCFVGLIFCLVAVILFVVMLVKMICLEQGFSNFLGISSIILFVGGIELFFIGIMGLYLSKIYLEVKNRPIYIIKETEKDYRRSKVSRIIEKEKKEKKEIEK